MATTSNLANLGLNEEQIAFLMNSSAASELIEKGWIPAPVTKRVKVKQTDGTFKEVFLGANAQYVTLESGDNVQDLLTWTEI